MVFFFFFSSRRRHTRCSRDWSSDVCSSDLAPEEADLPQRIVSGQPLDEDTTLDTTLRPKRLADFVGQPRIKDNLAIAIAAAKQRAEPLDHHLLYGPPGLGKTTLAHI